VSKDIKTSGYVPEADITYVDAGATVVADATDKGDGGKVVVWSNQKTSFGGMVYARAGAQGGDGGFVETSGAHLHPGGSVAASAPKGTAGTWLVDPTPLTVVTSGAGADQVNVGDIISTLDGGTNFTLSADTTIKFDLTDPATDFATTDTTRSS